MLRIICMLIGFALVAMAADQPTQGRAPATPGSSPHQLFIGIKGTVPAIDRASGQEVWRSRLKGNDFVNVVWNDGDLYAATHGEIFWILPPGRSAGTHRSSRVPMPRG